MKILLTTLNSKYVHSNLALKYLYTVVASEYSDMEIREFTINNEYDYVYTELVRANYDMVCFSCYIWNVEQTKRLAADLKKAKPEMLICIGGPEVTYRGPQFAQENPWADFIICGEGEYSFYRLCQVLHERNRLFHTVPGLIYRNEEKIYVNAQIEPMDFNKLPFPYSMLECEPDKVVYYESTRGCPFRCSYCLSSIDKSIRALDMDRVKADLGYFLFKKVMQVKFIDRTFNYDRERAYELFKYIIDNDNGITNFHFEICGDLLDAKTLKLLASARKGLFQMEIGIQSTNPQTLAAVNRKENVYPLLYNVERLIELGNIHTHVDLIAGLPYETYEIFERSFNKVYALQADALQLGFLKVLAGTKIAEEAERHGIVHRSYAPYEVISTDYITSGELAKLKMIENMLDIYYNRGGFEKSVDYLIGLLGKGAFGFYEDLAAFYYEQGFQHRDRKKEDQYRILLAYGKQAAAKCKITAVDEQERMMQREKMQQEVENRLLEDCQKAMNPEIFKRFMRKGWEITR